MWKLDDHGLLRIIKMGFSIQPKHHKNIIKRVMEIDFWINYGIGGMSQHCMCMYLKTDKPTEDTVLCEKMKKQKLFLIWLSNTEYIMTDQHKAAPKSKWMDIKHQISFHSFNKGRTHMHFCSYLLLHHLKILLDEFFIFLLLTFQKCVLKLWKVWMETQLGALSCSVNCKVYQTSKCYLVCPVVIRVREASLVQQILWL